MFGIACKWKHTKDVDGPIAEKVIDDEIAPSASIENKEKLQVKGVKKMQRACGSVVAKGEKECRQGCADRFGNAMQKRSKCDNTCVRSYDEFEARCMDKAENLKEVYYMNIKMEKARQTCYEGHCNHLPTVWLKSKEEDQ